MYIVSATVYRIYNVTLSVLDVMPWLLIPTHFLQACSNFYVPLGGGYYVTSCNVFASPVIAYSSSYHLFIYLFSFMSVSMPENRLLLKID